MAFEGEVGAVKRGVVSGGFGYEGEDALRDGVADVGGRRDLPRVFVLHILNGTSALYTTYCETSSVGEAADNPGLPFQSTLDGFVESVWVVQIHNVDVSVRGTDDQQLPIRIHGVDSLLTIDRGNRIRRPQIPVLDCFVPRACDQDRTPWVVYVDKAGTANGCVVDRYLCYVSGLNIYHTGRFVCAGAHYLFTILYTGLAEPCGP